MPADLHLRSTQRGDTHITFPFGGAHHGVGDSQSESSAVAFIGGSMEPVKETSALRRGDAGPVVLNGQSHPIAVRRHRDLYNPATSCVTAGVVHQDRGGPIHPLRR